jgi:hypothetical protein
MTSKATKKKVENQSSPDSPIEKRSFTEKAEVMLWALSGGRCEFCNKYLLEDWLTLAKGKYGQNAHIVAFKEDGPRGNVPNRPEKINDVSNLMLLCYEHHHLIDVEKPLEYTREGLEEMKRTHEERIKRLTSIKPENQTTVIRMQSKIGGDIVGISESDIKLALEPYYFPRERQFDIPLTQFDDTVDGFFDLAKEQIRRLISKLYDSQIDSKPVDHISVFALAPMPLLIFLGNCLSNKIQVDLYQRHRDTEDWKWKTISQKNRFIFEQIQSGNDKEKVALMLSLSGKIEIADLPNEIDDTFSIYEIALENCSPMFLQHRDTLNEFKAIYQTALRTIKANQGNIKSISLFPAVPAPVAVLCGKELLPKIDPELWVYDNDKRKKNKGFNLILKVNEYDR